MRARWLDGARCAAAKPRRGSDWRRRACCSACRTGKAAIRSRPLHSRSSPAPPVQEEFLWGNASLATALLIGKAFTARGWDMEPGDEREIGDLPAYTFARDGEREMQACAERFLTERQIETSAGGRTHPDRQPSRSQCRRRGSLSVGVGPTGPAGLVMHRRERGSQPRFRQRCSRMGTDENVAASNWLRVSDDEGS